MKAIRLLLALISFTSLSISANMDALDFSQDTFCPESPKAQLRGGLFYLPNNTEPYSGEALCSYLINGQNSVKGKIKNGLKVGKWSEWHPNGQLKSKYSYIDGSLNGVITEWHENGAIRTKGHYKEDLLNGFLVKYNNSGQVIALEGWFKGDRLKWNFVYSNSVLYKLLIDKEDLNERKVLNIQGLLMDFFREDIASYLSIVEQQEYQSETGFALLAENLLDIQAGILEEYEAAREFTSSLEEELAYEESVIKAEALDSAFAYIRDEISKRWRLPADARESMYVVVIIRLVPKGEVISVEVVAQDASDAMVASVKNAVLRVGRFDKLSELDPDVFDANFRKFRIMFRPADLNKL